MLSADTSGLGYDGAVMTRNTGPQILLVAAVTALALAANHFFFNWVLITESFLRRIMYG